MEKVLDILGVVKSRARRGVLSCLLFVSGLTGVDAWIFKN